MAHDAGDTRSLKVDAPLSIWCPEYVDLRAWNWRGSSEALLPTQPIEIERYAGPLLLSHGTADRVWSVAMTRRLEARLQAHGRTPEVYYYEGEDHVLSSEAENTHHTQLLDFFARHLAG